MAKRKVSLFIQCLVDSMFPHVGEAMVTVFDRLGIPLEYPPGQTCCGQPSFNAGYQKEARKAALHFIELFEDSEDIVCPSGSCVSMVRHDYPELFKDSPKMQERARAVGKRCYEFSEYLVDQLGVSDCGATFRRKVTYHDSCHLYRNLGIDRQPRVLLNNVKELELIEMKDSTQCCGFGGTFSINYPEISTALVDEKIKNILASGADVVCGCDMSCLMNIKGRLSRLGETVEVVHIAEILAGSEK
ncbi:(Fe-S)-binding protein [Desulforhopalus vacuolatus]|nr:(Fe-S)-binding protein [Desulforhopalus vacuolatus]